MSPLIVLIAPPGIALSAIGQQTASALNLPFYSIDDFTDEDWQLLGYDATADIQALAEGGVYASYRLLMPLRYRTVEKLLSEHQEGVVVLPADFIVQEDADLHQRMTSLFAKIPKVIWLTPSLDSQEQASLLDVDLAKFPDWGEVNAYWIGNPSNERLAKQVIYTEGKTVQQTCDEILNLRRADKPDEIILIGPKLTGKTTLGRMIADRLNLPQVSLDSVGGKYLAETDYHPATAAQLYQEQGVFGWLRYRRPYEAHIVERVLMDEHNCVIDFGGGHSVYEDERHFEQVQKALAPYSNVFLIMPSPDPIKSIEILRQRFNADVASERKLHRLLVTHDAYQQLATEIVLTRDKSTEAISMEVCERVK